MQQRQTDTPDPTSPGPSRRRALLALAVVHPVPSALNAGLVAVLALIAGGERSEAALLAIAMLGFQTSIGALNDIADVEADRLSKPRKPIPAGLVRTELAVGIVAIGAIVGLGISAVFGVVVLLLGALGYASGVAYDVGMRRLGLGWLCLAVAIPVMLAWSKGVLKLLRTFWPSDGIISFLPEVYPSGRSYTRRLPDISLPLPWNWGGRAHVSLIPLQI